MKNLKKRLKSKSGLTYIEILVALVVLSIIVITFSPMLMLAYKNVFAAGELNINTYNSKTFMEQELSMRTNDEDPLEGFIVRFKNLANNISTNGKRILSTVPGLETVFSGGVVKVTIDNSNFYDDTSVQSVLLRVVGMKIKPDGSNFVQGTQAQNDKLVYKVESLISKDGDKNKSFNATVFKVDKNKVTIFVDGVSVCDSPLQITLLYFNDDGVEQAAKAYMYIQPSSVMFVGKTDSNTEYFTTAGAGGEDYSINDFFISGRNINTQGAELGNGIKLNSIQWVPSGSDTANDGGFYVFTGEGGTIRRLWHLNQAGAEAVGAATAQLLYGRPATDTGLSDSFSKYTWGGDITEYTSATWWSASGGTGSDKTSVPTYGMTAHSALQFNGFAIKSGNGGTSESERVNAAGRTRRISYVLNPTEAQAKAMGLFLETDAWSGVDSNLKFTKFSAYRSKLWYIGPNAKDKNRRYVYCTDDGYWYKYEVSYDWRQVANCIDEMNRQDDMYGMYTLVDGRNAILGGYTYNIFNSVEKATTWGDGEASGSELSDKNLAQLVIKSMNNFISGGTSDLGQGSHTQKTTGNTPIITDCVYWGGSSTANSTSMLYLGYTPANAIINQTDAKANNTSEGSFTGYAFMSNAEGTATTIKKYVTADTDSSVARTGIANGTAPTSTVTDSNLRFTMGYLSNRGAFYTPLGYFNDDQYATIESWYYAAKGIAKAADANYKNNVWLMPEYFTYTAADSADGTVVAVGYNTSGYSKSNFTSWKANHGDQPLRDMKTTATESGVVLGKNVTAWKFGDDGENYTIRQSTNATASTGLDCLVNDAVIAVKYDGGSTLVPVYYKRGDNKSSLRFESVGVGKLNAAATKLTVVVSDNNGKLYVGELANGATSMTLNGPINQTVFSEINDIYVGNGKIVVTGKSSGTMQILVSTNGTSFTARNLGGAFNGNDIAYINGFYYIAASNAADTTGAIYCSKDATTWVSRTNYATGYSVDDEGIIHSSGNNANSGRPLPPMYAVAGRDDIT
ncbi:MAG: hypothetical protein GX051_07085 [Clostridiales bacterium]|nr:hypothetical protein [Clostridiales bacterium]